MSFGKELTFSASEDVDQTALNLQSDLWSTRAALQSHYGHKETSNRNFLGFISTNLIDTDCLSNSLSAHRATTQDCRG